MGLVYDDFLLGPIARLTAAIEKRLRREEELKAEDLDREVESTLGVPTRMLESTSVSALLGMLGGSSEEDAKRSALAGLALLRRSVDHAQQGRTVEAALARIRGNALLDAALEARPELEEFLGRARAALRDAG